MQLFVRIVEQGQADTREVTSSKSGEKINLTTMPFTLAQGDDVFFAEMLGEKALKMPKLNTNALYVADVQMSIRNIRSEKGDFIKNTITLRSITKFMDSTF